MSPVGGEDVLDFRRNGLIHKHASYHQAIVKVRQLFSEVLTEGPPTLNIQYIKHVHSINIMTVSDTEIYTPW